MVHIEKKADGSVVEGCLICNDKLNSMTELIHGRGIHIDKVKRGKGKGRGRGRGGGRGGRGGGRGKGKHQTLEEKLGLLNPEDF